MNTWIIVMANKAAADWVLDNERMAFRDFQGSPAYRLRTGDRAALYLSTRATGSYPSVVALCEITSEVVRSPVTIGDEVFALSCDWRVEARSALEGGVNFSQLVPSLSFIAKKTNWQFYVMRSPRSIPTEDFELIERAVLIQQA